MLKEEGGHNHFAAVLRIADFRNLWLSQVFSQVFLNLLVFSLIIRTYELTGRNTAVAVMVLMATIPTFLFGALAGILVDRWDRKIVMFLSHFLRIFAVLAFLLSSESLAWLYILMFLISIITQFFQPAESAMIGEMVKDKSRLLTANSLFSVTLFSSVVIGNVLSGLTLKIFGPHGTFLIVAAAFAVAAFFTARVPGESIKGWFVAMIKRPVLQLPLGGRQLEKQTLSEGLLGGLDYLHKNPLIRQAVYLMVIAQIVIQTLGAIATGFANKILLVEAADVSLVVMAPAALGMIMGAILVGQHFINVKKTTMIKVSMFAVAATLFLFSFVDQIASLTFSPLIPTAIIILVLLGATNAFMDIPINTIIQEGAPIGVRSRVYGMAATLIGAASVVPVLAAGTIGDLLGVRAVMIVMGVSLLALSVYYSKRLA